jgi:hypothetical protein
MIPLRNRIASLNVLESKLRTVSLNYVLLTFFVFLAASTR